MANANNFQASRPQPFYSQVQAGPSRSQTNVGFLAGQLPGLLQSAGLIKGLLGDNPADKYNLAMAGESEQRALKGVWDRIQSVQNPDDRKKLFMEEQKQNPNLLGKYDPNNINFANLKENDPIKMAAHDAQRGMVGAFQGTQQENFGVDMAGNQQLPPLAEDPNQTAAGIGSQQQTPQPAQGLPLTDTYNTTQGDIPPTEVYSGQGEFPAAQISSEDQTQQSPTSTTWNEGEVPPEPTQVPIDKGPADPQAQAKHDAVKMMNERGYPITEEDLWVSPNTGEVKLNPALATRFPEFGPGAYEDVLAAGPEDAGIKQAVTENAPNMANNQLRAMQLGSIMRVARSYDLNLQPSPEDIYTATMPLTDLKLLAADLRVKTGLPYDEEYLNPDLIKMAIAHGQWKRADVSNEIRKDPETVRLLLEKAKLPPEYQKLVETYGESFATSSMKRQEYMDKLTQLDALNDIKNRELGIDRERNLLRFETDSGRNSAAMHAADASHRHADAAEGRNLVAAAKIQSEAPLNMARLKKYEAETKNLETKGKLDANTISKQELDLMNNIGSIVDKKAEIPGVMFDRYNKMYETTQKEINSIDREIGDLIAKLPSAQAGVITSIVMNSNKTMTAKEKQELMQNGIGAQTLSQIENLQNRKTAANTQAVGVDGNGGYKKEMDKYLGEIESSITGNTPLATQQAEIYKTLLTRMPVMGEQIYERTIIRNLNHPQAENVFRMLDRLDAKSAAAVLGSGDVKTMVKNLRTQGGPLMIGSDVVQKDSDLEKIVKAYDAFLDLKLEATQPKK